MSALALLINLGAVGVYGYSIYYMTNELNEAGMTSILPAPLRVYGHFKFLTFQCLLFQMLNAVLHVGAHFSSALKRPRDLVFSCLAYPVGSIVVYSFWAVWHLQGREHIFPAELSKFYPDWLNHATHSVIAPLNLLMAALVEHKYSRNGVLLTLIYFGFYTALLHFIKFKTGLFVYRYLNTMGDNQRLVYFALTGVFAYLMYKSGQLITSLAHGKASQRPPVAQGKKGNKQK